MEGRTRFGTQMLVGALFILAGGALLLDNQGLLEVRPLWRFWPVLLIGLGILKIVNAETRKDQGSGLWLLFLGAWFLVSILHLWGLSFGDTWPVLFIALGVSMLWKSLPPKSPTDSIKEVSHGE